MKRPLTGFGAIGLLCLLGGCAVAPATAPTNGTAITIAGGVEGIKETPPAEDAAVGTQTAIDPTRPRPRPQVVKAPQVRPAVLTQDHAGVANMGITGLNPRWSAYGDYMKRLIEAVQIRWDEVLSTGKAYPPSGTSVAVRFVLNSSGRIARIVNVDNRSTEKGASFCVSAITDPAPYAPWTKDMIALLGTEQELTFTFYYQ